MSRSRSRDVIYNNIPVGVASELYLFPEMEADCSELSLLALALSKEVDAPGLNMRLKHVHTILRSN